MLANDPNLEAELGIFLEGMVCLLYDVTCSGETVSSDASMFSGLIEGGSVVRLRCLMVEVCKRKRGDT